MAIVAIMLGENLPDTDGRFGRIPHHGDIVDLLPRKRDAQGDLLPCTLGAQGDREFFGLQVNLDHLTDEEHEAIRRLLRDLHDAPVRVDSEIDPETGETVETVVRRLDGRRKRGVDFARRVEIGLSNPTVQVIGDIGDLRRERRIAEMDARVVTRLDVVVPWLAFARAVVNKATGQTLQEEYNLSLSTDIREVAQAVIAEPVETRPVVWE